MDRTATAEPGSQQLKLAGGARSRSGAGPNGGRVHGREGMGEKGMCEASKALRAAGGHGGTGEDGSETAVAAAGGAFAAGTLHGVGRVKDDPHT